MSKFALCTLAALIALPAFAQNNPHDGYIFWLPAGELIAGDKASEQKFQYAEEDGGATFVIRPRDTRFGVARGQIALISTRADYSADVSVGETVFQGGAITFLPHEVTDGKREVKVAVSRAPRAGEGFRFYYTDDADKLGVPLSGDLNSVPSPRSYVEGVKLLRFGDPTKAHDRLMGGVTKDKSPEAARLLRRLARWAAAKGQLAKVKSGEGAYKLGLYCMYNGFWELAQDCFTLATQKMPKNPDAWYMLADAMSYAESDLDQGMARIIPYYRKAADLYPREGSNTYRNHIGFFKKFLVKDGDRTVTLTMTDEQMDYVRKTWGWCSTIMEAASRGALRIVNRYEVYEDEFDNTSPFDPRPFMGLFEPGTTETFFKFTGWGASDCLGHDCGPDRSASINMGLREWDVMLHEWNHSLDWAMISGELGVGVPVTHSSDWCGFEPISSMGMGHHSCNRYYMTPGMYLYVRGSDPITTPHIGDWLVGSPTLLLPETAQVDDAFTNKVRTMARQVTRPDSVLMNRKPVVENGYVDLMKTFPGAPKNAVAFAQTYVYSPVRQKVRMWVGADDNLRLWLNDRLIHDGVYWAVVLFQEAKEKDQTAKGVYLEKGWNVLTAQVTNAQHSEDWLITGEKPDCWGFSIRVCDNQNRAVPGLKWQSAKPNGFVMPTHPFDPKKPATYDWWKVASDYTELLPHLTLDDLRAVTGYKSLAVNDAMLFDLSGEEPPAGFADRVISGQAPNDMALNNHLTWYFSPKEMAAMVRYRRGGQTRDLLFLRPEAYETFFSLLPVTPEAKRKGITDQSKQVIGYFTVKRDDCPNGRIVLVVDTYLGDKLPTEEADLLSITGLR